MTDAAAPPATPRPAVAAIDWAALWLLVVVWGSAYAGSKIAAAEIAPLWITCGRTGLGACLLAGLAAVFGRQPPPLKGPQAAAWGWYGAIGLFGLALPFFLFAWAAKAVDSTLLAIINGASPMFTAVLAALMLKGETLTWRRGLGVGVGFLGLAALSGPAALGAFGAAAPAAVAAGLAATLCYALANVVTKQAPQIDPIIAGAILCAASAVATLPLAIMTASIPVQASPAALGAVAALGLFPTGLGSWLYVLLIRRRGPMFVAYVMYLSPLWAALIGLTLMQERPGPWAAAALALILLGLWIANAQPNRKPASRD